MMDDSPPISKKLDSHASFMTNRFIVMHKAQIDALGFQAANSLHYGHIAAFYNAIEVWYISLKDLMKEGNAEDGKNYRTKIENCRKIYCALKEKIETDARYRNRKALQVLLDITKEFYSLIITGMQEYQYFFRLSNINHKGLSKMSFLQNSIFNTKKSNKNDRETEDEI